MEQIINWISEYWWVFIAVGAALDTLVGVIPDKWIPYIGAVRTFLKAIKGGGK